MSTSGEYPPARQCFNQYCPSLCDLKEAKFSDSKILLCTQCFELYSRKKCCYFCAQVYKDDEQNFLDGKKWVQCDNGKCGKWVNFLKENFRHILIVKNQILSSNYKISDLSIDVHGVEQRNSKKKVHSSLKSLLVKIQTKKNMFNLLLSEKL